ncbi:unnamed protein product [Rhizophagus irregularis]|nr:unnamed protein product [Rhizophagus irregularis]
MSKAYLPVILGLPGITGALKAALTAEQTGGVDLRCNCNDALIRDVDCNVDTKDLSSHKLRNRGITLNNRVIHLSYIRQQHNYESKWSPREDSPKINAVLQYDHNFRFGIIGYLNVTRLARKCRSRNILLVL